MRCGVILQISRNISRCVLIFIAPRNQSTHSFHDASSCGFLALFSELITLRKKKWKMDRALKREYHRFVCTLSMQIRSS